jgi:hypothetical protein
MVEHSHRCPVCGYSGLIEAPRSRNNVPSFEICSSCGFQFGVTDDDDEQSYVSWRDQWIRRGMPWFTKGLRPQPEPWDPQQQLDDLLRGN